MTKQLNLKKYNGKFHIRIKNITFFLLVKQIKKLALVQFSPNVFWLCLKSIFPSSEIFNFCWNLHCNLVQLCRNNTFVHTSAIRVISWRQSAS